MKKEHGPIFMKWNQGINYNNNYQAIGLSDKLLDTLMCLFFKGAPCPNELTINVTGGGFDQTGPLACRSLFPV